MVLSEIVLSLILSATLHTTGHYQQAYIENIDMDINWRTFTEEWHTPSKGKATRINMAGFAMQDKAAREYKYQENNTDFFLINASYKLLYVSGIHLGGLSKGYGDINSSERTSGNPIVEEIMLASIISDYYQYKHPESKTIIYPVAIKSGVGLALEHRF